MKIHIPRRADWSKERFEFSERTLCGLVVLDGPRWLYGRGPPDQPEEDSCRTCWRLRARAEIHIEESAQKLH